MPDRSLHCSSSAERRSSDAVFRVYEPDECGPDGYPLAWHKIDGGPGVKHLVRELAGHRCIRCQHPYECGVSKGEWSPCDEACLHISPYRWRLGSGYPWTYQEKPEAEAGRIVASGLSKGVVIEAAWRILTVHHLRLGHDAKRDLRWWNLAALCQRCHLQIQGKVVMERIWPWPHSDWFKPYAAGWYAHTYLGEDLTREQVEARLDELLALELAA